MWLPTYHTRNVANLNKLGDATKKAAFIWYSWVVENKIDILIYETIRTVEKQRENVAKGASQTMKSYHIVGQALDFVPIINGKEGWNSYSTRPFLTSIEKAEQLGFESGYRWKWDAPHLQYNYRGYGTDTFKTGNMDIGQSTPSPTPVTNKGYLEKGDSGDSVKELQTLLNKLGYNVGEIDGDFGTKTDEQVRKFQSDKGLIVDGVVGENTMKTLKSLTETSAPPSNGIIGVIRVRVPKLNIRSGAGVEHGVIKVAVEGEVYNVTTNKDNLWMQIIVDNQTQGWVNTGHQDKDGAYVELVR